MIRKLTQLAKKDNPSYHITMCDGKGCLLRAACHRARVYNQYKKDQGSKPSAIKLMEGRPDCQFYWRVRNE